MLTVAGVTGDACYRFAIYGRWGFALAMTVVEKGLAMAGALNDTTTYRVRIVRSPEADYDVLHFWLHFWIYTTWHNALNG
jgi:hypothetical protein